MWHVAIACMHTHMHTLLRITRTCKISKRIMPENRVLFVVRVRRFVFVFVFARI